MGPKVNLYIREYFAKDRPVFLYENLFHPVIFLFRYQNENDTTASHYHVAMHPTHHNQDLMLFSGTKKECVLLNDGQNAFIDSVIFISVPKRIIIQCH